MKLNYRVQDVCIAYSGIISPPTSSSSSSSLGGAPFNEHSHLHKLTPFWAILCRPPPRRVEAHRLCGWRSSSTVRIQVRLGRPLWRRQSAGTRMMAAVRAGTCKVHIQRNRQHNSRVEYEWPSAELKRNWHVTQKDGGSSICHLSINLTAYEI